jgi:flavin reductase (DIM6/NTAB) family NADH-FMN oxidoreductase RutF
MNATSKAFPAGVDELQAAGLTALPSRLVRPPRVAESPVHMECRVWQIIALPSHDPAEPNFLVIGEVVGIHVADELIKDGRVDILAARPIARMGYSEYSTVDSKFIMKRPG